MTTVLVVGMAVIDFLFEVESMPDTCEKYSAHTAKIVGGGGAANAACAIAKLGGQAQLSARVGNDFIGKLIIEGLQQQSIDCSLLMTTEGARSSYSSVLVDARGERQIVNFRGSGLSDDVSKLQSANPDAVLADTRWSAGVTSALRLAREKKVPGVLDAEAPVDMALFNLASHVAFSRQGLESIAGTLHTVGDIESALRQLAASHGPWFAMTDGANGVYSFQAGQFVHHAAIPVDAVDTLGAGDVWHGAFTYWLACGYNENESVEFANMAAALKCTRSGGGRSCPDINQVKSALSINVSNTGKLRR